MKVKAKEYEFVGNRLIHETAKVSNSQIGNIKVFRNAVVSNSNIADD